MLKPNKVLQSSHPQAQKVSVSDLLILFLEIFGIHHLHGTSARHGIIIANMNEESKWQHTFLWEFMR